MHSSETEALLNDLLLGDDYPQHRAGLKRLAAAEYRRRHSRPPQWALGAAALLILLLSIAGLAARRRSPQSSAVDSTPRPAALNPPSPFLVRSKPLQPAQLLRTDRLSNVISTHDPRGSWIVQSAPLSTALVQTPAHAAVATLTDSELLAAFPSKPTFLATVAPGRKTFILLENVGPKEP